MTLGLTLSVAGHHNEALPQFRVSLDGNPNWALGRTMYGLALIRAGEFDEAIIETATVIASSIPPAGALAPAAGWSKPRPRRIATIPKPARSCAPETNQPQR